MRINEDTQHVEAVRVGDTAHYVVSPFGSGGDFELYQQHPDDDLFWLVSHDSAESATDTATTYNKTDTYDVLGIETDDPYRVTTVQRQDPETDREETLQSVEEQLGWHRGVITAALWYPDYEQVGTDTVGDRAVDVYEPRQGWMRGESSSGDTTTYRITDADGTLLVDSDTGTVVGADVSYGYTASAETYYDYVQTRYFEDPTHELSTLPAEVIPESGHSEIEIEVKTEETGEITRPEWANGDS